MTGRGSEFVALRRISDRNDRTLAAVGELCGQVPDEALGWLEASGRIRRVDGAPAPEPASEPEAMDRGDWREPEEE